MAKANIDLGVFQETKCTDDIYIRASAGYRVVATDALSRHRGRIAVFYREGAGFVVTRYGSTGRTCSASR